MDNPDVVFWESPAGWKMLWVGAFCSMALTLFCWVQMGVRYRHHPFFKKLVWSLIVVVPFLGPIFYGAWYHRVSPQDGIEGGSGGWGAESSHGDSDWGGGSDGGGSGGGGEG